MKYTIKKIDLSKGAEETYTTFFYKRDLEVVYEVKTDGFTCAAAVKAELNIRHCNHGTTMPKYIQSSCSYAQEYGVGFEFINGECKACKIEIIKGGLCYYSVEGLTCLYIDSVEDIARIIELGKENFEYREKCRKESERVEAEEAHELSRYNDIDGFGSELNNMQLSKVRKTLNKTMMLEGCVMSVKDAIKTLCKEGYRPDTFSYWSKKTGKKIENKLCFMNKETGSLYDSKFVTKTAAKYMNYLLENNLI